MIYTLSVCGERGTFTYIKLDRINSKISDAYCCMYLIPLSQVNIHINVYPKPEMLCFPILMYNLYELR